MRPMFSISRRRFLQLTGGAVLAAPVFAAEPFNRTGRPRLNLSLAAYSFRDFFEDSTKPGKAPREPRLDMHRFIDFCAEHGCVGAELTSYFFPKDVTAEALREVRRHAFLRGVEVSGTSVGNTFTFPPGPERDLQLKLVKDWIARAAVLGAPHIRVFAGNQQKGQTAEEAQRLTVEALAECCDFAGTQGIFLGLENHGGIVAEPEALIAIVRAVKSPWLGINLDTGNFHTADPYAALAQCAPYAVNVQVKTEIRPAGAKENAPADLPRLIKILRDANYQGWVVLEYEAKEDPWTAVPPLLAKLRGLLADQPNAGGAAWLPLFDGKTLAGWRATDFSGAGDVIVEDGAIVLAAGNDLTGITYPGELPKTNYEVELEAKKVQGGDFFCGLTFPVADSHCTLVVGGWGGALVGISSIDGNDASENETTQFRKFVEDKWYRIRVRVAPERIDAWIDDEQLVNVDIAERAISMRPGEIELSKPFGIASFRTRAALRGIKMRKL